MALDFEVLPRLLQELCDGPCMQYREQVFAFDQPGRARRWYCRGCYITLWFAAGKPEQPQIR